ncbi:MAG: acyl-CoA dehydratase activase [Armatimonadota bacterium]
MPIRIGLDIGSDTIKTIIYENNNIAETLDILKVEGKPVRKVKTALEKVLEYINNNEDVYCGITGSGASSIAKLIDADAIHEPNAIASAIDHFYPEVRTVIEMGRETQKYLLFERDPVSGRLLVEDSSLGNKCASGSGSFLDHMAKRLNYDSIEEFAKIAAKTKSPASLSGRCAVFTESDIVHLYQKGTPKERIAAGIHQAISRNYRSAISRGKEFRDKIAFIGGVSENPAVIRFLSEELELGNRLFVPEHNRTIGAIGAAIRAEKKIFIKEALAKIDDYLRKPLEYPGCEPIKMEISEIMPPLKVEEVPSYIERAALGVDIGSVSTKAALVTEIDGKIKVIASYYRRTNGNPLEAVKDTLSVIKKQIDDMGVKIKTISAATTGSGRYLTADYIGADIIRNEITAQASGALSYADDIDTIFEIGGQDSKYIRLDGDIIIDFEMNKACAAGTGAFLEKQAMRLDIPLEEFGDTALKNTRPPDLDWTCTVFSESAMVYYQQNNVPVEDLAAGICLASVKNYLNKNVGSRAIGNKIAFQGAVAFNKGMIAAYETVLGRKIIVPPYPHITGAVGVARLAYYEAPEASHFRGFDTVLDSEYEISSFECKSCANRCDVNTFQMKGGKKYFYNDRCEKFSGDQKENLGEHLPDLFAEREELLMNSYTKPHIEGAKSVGIPRGLMFSEYYPLYAAFFGELGFNVVPSDPTNKRIIEMGLDLAIGEPCFPFKVAHGHFMDLVEKKVDIIFAPAVLNTEQRNPNFRQSQTCPYLQAAPDVISSAVGIKERGIQLLAPRLHFKRGRRHIENQFIESAKKLGISPSNARKAFDTALNVLNDFRKKIDLRGAEILKSLGKDDMAFIVVGRPYSLYDQAVNMDIGKKIQDLGILAIPQDFLPLEAADITDVWSGIYSRQIQKKIMAARIIRQDKRLRAVVLTYFACGPDSFGNPFFKEEIGEPCYMMQIDEHTADAGVITRIEAFSDTVHKDSIHEYKQVRTGDSPITQMENRRVWIPFVNGGAKVLAAAMRAYGIDAEALPRSPDEGLNLARAAISEDVCLPALMTTEDMLYRIKQPDFDPKKEAFFQGNSEGPCRFGMYSMLQRIILDKLGYDDVEIVTLGSKSEHGGLGTMFALLTWDGIICHDLLFKMMLKSRPYEINSGESEALYEDYLNQLITMIPEHKKRLEFRKISALLNTKHLDQFQELLRRAQEDFLKIPKRNEKRPLVGVVGEFYVRLHNQANQDILKKLEAEGAETWLAPMSEFFSYANFIAKVLSGDKLKETFNMDELKEFTSRWVNNRLAIKDEHALFEATLPYLKGYDDICSDEIIEKGSKYVHYTFGGETICSMGKGEDFAVRGLSGIVSVIPFNCMPGNVVTSLSQALRRRHNNIPFLNLDYDGFIDAGRDAKIVNFMWQVKERFEGVKDTDESIFLQDTSGVR